MQDSSKSIRRNVWNRFRKNKSAVFGLVIIGMSVLVAIFAYFLAPDSTPNANRMIVEIGARKPGFTLNFLPVKKQRPVAIPSLFERLAYGRDEEYDLIPITGYEIKGDSMIVSQWVDENITEQRSYALRSVATSSLNKPPLIKHRFWLGTDKYGRDILSRLLVGVRVSLGVGLVTVIISLTVGLILGAFAGYYGGRTDNIIMWFINIIWSIPTLLLVFAITLTLGKGFWQVFIAIGLTMWVGTARIVRGQIMSVRELEYVEAARALGYSDPRILFRHILPNILGPVLVVAASNFASAIVIEAGLSFLGIGVQPPQPSWGLMIRENYNFIITHNPMLALVPGIAIMTLVLAFNLVGNGLRDAMDVREV